MSTQGVYNVDAVAGILGGYGKKRIDIALAADSNAVFATNTGHFQGGQKAISNLIGKPYSVGVRPIKRLGGFASIFHNVNHYTSNLSSSSPLPSYFEDYELDSGLGIDDWLTAPSYYLNDGSNLSSGQIANIFQLLTGDEMFDANLALSFHLNVGTFASGTAARYQPGIRKMNTTNYVIQDTEQDSVTGTDGIIDYSLAIPAGDRASGGLQFVLNPVAATSLEGPFYASFTNVEFTQRTAGVSYHLSMYQGGHSSYDCCRAMKATPIKAIAEYLRTLVKLQNGTKQLIFQIIHGGNDRYEIGLSWNHTTQDFDQEISSTAKGFANNIDGIRKYITDAWESLKYDKANLAFLVGAYHPIGVDMTIGGITKPSTQWLSNYYDEVIDRGHPDTCVIKGEELTTVAVMEANGEYANTSSYAHLTQVGYENHGTRWVSALLSAAAESNAKRGLPVFGNHHVFS